MTRTPNIYPRMPHVFARNRHVFTHFLSIDSSIWYVCYCIIYVYLWIVNLLRLLSLSNPEQNLFWPIGSN